MYCPHFILMHNRFFSVTFHTDGDLSNMRRVPLQHWFQPDRWEIAFYTPTYSYKRRRLFTIGRERGIFG